MRVSQHKGEPPCVEDLEFCEGELNSHPLLLKHLAKSRNLKKTHCNTYIHNQFYQLLLTDKPSVPDEDLTNALHWEIKDLLINPIDDVTLDTFSAPDYGIGKKHINIVAANKAKISEIAKQFEEAKLDLNAIDIEEFAIRNLVILDKYEKLGVVTLWLSSEHGKILFFSDDNLHLIRNIDIGFNAITNNLNGMENIALEVQRSIDYFERHYNQIPISNLLLMPIGLESSGFEKFLKQNLSLSCHKYEIEKHIKGLDNIDAAKLSKFLLTIGLGLRQEQRKADAVR
ncbi:MAG: hypothetical protein OEM38_07310 [Gammaproteobacteria bacterium]|nr:hypothetical protein [Gammaproteobacteria bacterium]